MIAGNPIQIARSMKPGETAKVMFSEYRRLRTFTVQLSEYNNVIGRKLGVYVHAASKKQKLEMYLVAVTAEERKEEQENYDMKGKWREKIPEEWLNQ